MTAGAQVDAKLVQQIAATRNPDDGLAYLSETICLEYGFADTTIDIGIPASAADPVYVTDVRNLITAAFTGGTATVDVGDGSSVGLYIANAAVTEGTIGDLVKSAVGAKLVANAKIRVTVGAGNTAGAGALFVTLFKPNLHN